MCQTKRHKNLISSIYPKIPGQSQLNQSNLSYFLYYLQTRPHKLNKSLHFLYLLTLRFIHQKSDSFHLITLKIINSVLEQNKNHLNLYIIHLYKIIKELLKVCVDLQQTAFNIPDNSLPALDNPLLPSLMNTFMLINSTYDGSLNIDEEFSIIQKDILNLLIRNIITSGTPTAHSISYYALIGIQSIVYAPWIVANKLGEDLLNTIIPELLAVLIQLNVSKATSDKKSPVDLNAVVLDPLSQLIVNMLSQFTAKLSTAHFDKLSGPLFQYITQHSSQSTSDKQHVHSLPRQPSSLGTSYPFIIQYLLLILGQQATYQVKTILLSTILDQYKQYATKVIKEEVATKQYETTNLLDLLNLLNQWFLLPTNQHVAIPMLELVQTISFPLKETYSTVADDPLNPSFEIVQYVLYTISTLLVNPYHSVYIYSTLKWLMEQQFRSVFATTLSFEVDGKRLQIVELYTYRLLKYCNIYVLDQKWSSEVPHPSKVLCSELFVPMLKLEDSILVIFKFLGQILQLKWTAHIANQATEMRHLLLDISFKYVSKKMKFEDSFVNDDKFLEPIDLILIRHVLIGSLNFSKLIEHKNEPLQLLAWCLDLQDKLYLQVEKELNLTYKTSLVALQMTILAILFAIFEHLELINLRHVVVEVFFFNLEAKHC
eukprot:NODE_27_length_39007_cov_1.590650.p5 type:complete len:656 gc:universal NODE_27_length_39007_cov_1.590650:4057-2090(-)